MRSLSCFILIFFKIVTFKNFLSRTPLFRNSKEQYSLVLERQCSLMVDVKNTDDLVAVKRL